MTTKILSAIEEFESANSLREKIASHKLYYSLEIFPNSETLTDQSSRDSISAKMGRHMCDVFLKYIDEETNKATLFTACLKVAVEYLETLAKTDERCIEANETLAEIERILNVY